MGNIIQSKINLKFTSYPKENYMINWPNSEHSQRDRIENTDDKLRAIYLKGKMICSIVYVFCFGFLSFLGSMKTTDDNIIGDVVFSNS